MASAVRAESHAKMLQEEGDAVMHRITLILKRVIREDALEAARWLAAMPLQKAKTPLPEVKMPPPRTKNNLLRMLRKLHLPQWR